MNLKGKWHDFKKWFIIWWAIKRDLYLPPEKIAFMPARQSDRHLVQTATVTVVAASYGATFVLPALFVVMGTGEFGDVPPAAWFFAFVIQLSLGWVTVQGVHHLKALGRYSSLPRLETELENTQKSAQRLIGQFVTIQYALATLREYLIPTNSDLKISIDKLLEPLDQNRVKALGFSDSEAISSIALFVFNDASQKLDIVARKCDSRLIPENRSWRSGEGHAGKTYNHHDPKFIWFSPDAEKETILRDSLNERDKKYYKSFISILLSVGNRRIGVLTISSSKVGQFTENEYVVLCTMYRHILSLYFSRYSPETLLKNDQEGKSD